MPASEALASALRRSVRLGGAILRGFLLLAASVLLLPYLLVPAYEPLRPQPFSGAQLYNPYADIGPTWQRANFHAHSRAWGGITSGHQTVNEVRAAYVQRGYSVIGLSNYHTIARADADTAFLPIYEHGFSIRKTHQLMIGAPRVMPLDFPLWQTRDAKQYLLQRLRDSVALTAVVHPYLRTGYERSELASVGGFDLLEVRSHWDDASPWWDAVLTAGNPIWGIGNDDVHDVSKPRETGVVWTMVNAGNNTPDTILSALRRGAMYVVDGMNGPVDARLVNVTVRGDSITTTFDRPMTNVKVLGAGGAVLSESSATTTVMYVMQPSDRYARVVATTPTGMLYLNPVIRTVSGAPQPRQAPPVEVLRSILNSGIAGGMWVLSLVVLLPGALGRSARARLAGMLMPTRSQRSVGALLLMVAALMLPHSLDAQYGTTALPFKAGEYNEYDLKFGAITVGSGSLSVSGPETLRGREVLRLKYQITGGIPFFRVNDVMESWFDPVNMLSLRFTQNLNEGPKHYDRLFDFYPDEGVVLERGQPRAETVAQPLDDAAFIFYVRTLRLEVGQTLSFNRYFRPDANPVTIRVLRRESLTVPAGTFNTIVIQPIIKTSGIFGEGGKAELWFTDDPTHTLVQMKAKLSFGSLSLYLRPSRNRR
jgi:hypothetical protein